VVAVAVPTFEPTGQLNGFAAYVASGHAFCSVVRPRRQRLGEFGYDRVDVRLMRALQQIYAQRRSVRFESRRVGRRARRSEKLGLKGSALQ